ncbi:MAG: anthranilate synthase component I [Cyanobacteriota bacterium]|nr:anthranilate synthase component I [Cyanobacteriota bacterium]
MNVLQPWHWRSLPLQSRSGSQIFAALFLHRDPIATLLESPDRVPPETAKLARYSICAGSPRILNGQPQLWTPRIGEILPCLRRLLESNRERIPDANAPAHLPFTGGWLGWLGYDLAWEIERLPHLNNDPLPFPVAYWYEPECFAVLDRLSGELWLAATKPQQLDEMQQHLEEPQTPNPKPYTPTHSKLSILSSQAEYEAAVRQAKQYIRAGDIFQTNLSVRFEVPTSASSWAIYRELQRINPSPFASYWQTPWGVMASCSPERLVSLHDGIAQTRPIAGTRSRGKTPQGDRALERELRGNIKENAEHIMLVDLERNDLGRVCQWGSVKVDELLEIERYSHVMHLVSNVTGTLNPTCDAVDLIHALFPGGTITGCPKVRCMEIIEELEPVRRSLFYGSCGYLDWRGNLDLNILIRTLLYADRGEEAIVWGQVGAGIVADSDPEREWYESLQKARAQLAALQITL